MSKNILFDGTETDLCLLWKKQSVVKHYLNLFNDGEKSKKSKISDANFLKHRLYPNNSQCKWRYKKFKTLCKNVQLFNNSYIPLKTTNSEYHNSIPLVRTTKEQNNMFLTSRKRKLKDNIGCKNLGAVDDRLQWREPTLESGGQFNKLRTPDTIHLLYNNSDVTFTTNGSINPQEVKQSCAFQKIGTLNNQNNYDLYVSGMLESQITADEKMHVIRDSMECLSIADEIERLHKSEFDDIFTSEDSYYNMNTSSENEISLQNNERPSKSSKKPFSLNYIMNASSSEADFNENRAKSDSATQSKRVKRLKRRRVYSKDKPEKQKSKSNSGNNCQWDDSLCSQKVISEATSKTRDFVPSVHKKMVKNNLHLVSQCSKHNIKSECVDSKILHGTLNEEFSNGHTFPTSDDNFAKSAPSVFHTTLKMHDTGIQFNNSFGTNRLVEKIDGHENELVFRFRNLRLKLSDLPSEVIFSFKYRKNTSDINQCTSPKEVSGSGMHTPGEDPLSFLSSSLSPSKASQINPNCNFTKMRDSFDEGIHSADSRSKGLLVSESVSEMLSESETIPSLDTIPDPVRFINSDSKNFIVDNSNDLYFQKNNLEFHAAPNGSSNKSHLNYSQSPHFMQMEFESEESQLFIKAVNDSNATGS